jgi:hypothetical protein
MLDFRRASAAVILPACLVLSGCARFGFTDRVLHSVRSPDGEFVAVCQEVPVLDGPDFDIRLHRPDGTLMRRLYGIGDGDPCHEVVWSPDSKALAVLSRHVGRIVLVDIEEALRRPPAERLWPRSVSLTDRGDVASNLRFVGPRRIAYLSCAAGVARPWNSPEPFTCTTGATDRRLGISSTPSGLR